MVPSVPTSSVAQRVALVVDRRGQRREMQDGVDRAVDAPRARDVLDAQAEAGIVREVADVVAASRDEAVDADHLGAICEQAVSEMGTEKACAAGHDDARRRPGHGTARRSGAGFGAAD